MNDCRRRLGLFHVKAGFLAFTLALGSPAIHAQAIEPRSFTNAPVGLNFLLRAYVRTEGGLSVDPSLPLTNAHVRTDTGLFAYARSFDVLGRSAKFDVIVPYGRFSGTGDVAGQPLQREM